jgi:hypothetical protein
MIQHRLRRDYPGEFVILQTRWVNGRKEQVREWVENPIDNQHISGRAAVIGSDLDAEFFDYTRLQKHRGGLLGKKRLQTYVAGDIWQEMRADFTVETEELKLNEILKSQYQEQNIVYTTATNCIRHPGEFYLIPFNPKLDVLALPAYLAAFDGHQEIFMLGYNNQTQSGTKTWHSHVDLVLRTYPEVKFVFVGHEQNTPEMWRKHRNVECWDYRHFVTYCDV